jgi:hypothetical protein
LTGARFRAAAALAALLAAGPVRAYVRTTDRTTGQSLSWPVPAVPWHLNRDWAHTAPSCLATAAGDPTFDAVHASFVEWEQPCTDLRLLYAGPSTETRVGAGGDGGNVVVFRRGWCSQDPAVVDPITHAIRDPCFSAADGDCGATHDCFQDSTSCIGSTSCADWGIVALTSVLYDPSTGRIMSADIEVNGWDGTAGSLGGGLPAHGWYFTCHPGAQPALTCTAYGQGTPPDAACAYVDLQNTVTHEVGHFLGLAHPCSTTGGAAGLPSCSAPLPAGETVAYAERTMSPSTQPGETRKRTLSADDIAGICDIYPAPSGGCGCGAGSGAGALSLLLTAVALRARRRKGIAPRRLRRR